MDQNDADEIMNVERERVGHVYSASLRVILG
jgi:hypothetical protein